MEFIWAPLLFALLSVPCLVALYLWAQNRRKKYALRFSNLSLVSQAAGRAPGRRRHIPPALFLVGIILLLIALARPVASVTLPDRESTVILAIDVSGSMRAQDVRPSRIEAAKAAAKAFIDTQSADVHIGIVAFSGNAALVQPPTTDHAALYAALDRLTLGRWTAIGSGILTSLDAIFENPDSSSGNGQPNSASGSSAAPDATITPVPRGQYAPALIILLSDGQSNSGPSPITGAQEALKRGVRVYTIGVGTVQGTTLNGGGGNPSGGGGGGPFGSGGFGRGFRSFLDEDTLKQVAQITDAKYYYAKDADELRTVYQTLDTRTLLRTQLQEITVLFTGAGAVIIFVAGMLSLFWFNRLP